MEILSVSIYLQRFVIIKIFSLFFLIGLYFGFFYVYSLHIKEENKKNNIYIFDRYKALTDVLSVAHNISYKTLVFNLELASRWASYGKERNISQALVAYSKVVLFIFG